MQFPIWGRKAILAAMAVMVAGCVLKAPEAPPSVEASPRADRFTQPGAYNVESMRGTWHDSRRDRDVPWLVRYPSDAPGPRPVMLFSHGLGGSREGLARMSIFLAGHGYVVAHVQHKGSDTSIWNGVRPQLSTVDRDALLKTASEPSVMLNRVSDIPFALDQLRAMSQSGPLKGRLEMERVAMAGHSFGAVTTQAIAGQVFPNGASVQMEGFRAFIAMSPSGNRNGNDKAAFAKVSQPFLMMTGTEDSFALNPSVQTAQDRLRPYYALPEGLPAVLVNLTGGDHFVFSGQALTEGVRPQDQRHHEIVDAAVLAFLDAFLLGDAGARAWIVEGLQSLSGNDAFIDSRNLAP